MIRNPDRTSERFCASAANSPSSDDEKYDPFIERRRSLRTTVTPSGVETATKSSTSPEDSAPGRAVGVFSHRSASTLASRRMRCSLSDRLCSAIFSPTSMFDIASSTTFWPKTTPAMTIVAEADETISRTKATISRVRSDRRRIHLNTPLRFLFLPGVVLYSNKIHMHDLSQRQE